MHKSLASLVKFILEYFILLDAVVNGIVFLILSSGYSLLVYRNATYLHELILYPATLLNLFISSNNFYFLIFSNNF